MDQINTKHGIISPGTVLKGFVTLCGLYGINDYGFYKVVELMGMSFVQFVGLLRLDKPNSETKYVLSGQILQLLDTGELTILNGLEKLTFKKEKQQ